MRILRRVDCFDNLFGMTNKHQERNYDHIGDALFADTCVAVQVKFVIYVAAKEEINNDTIKDGSSKANQPDEG